MQFVQGFRAQIYYVINPGRACSPKCLPYEHPLEGMERTALVLTFCQTFCIFQSNMSVLLTLFHAGQAAVSVYAGTFSAIAIYNLQKREEQSERAAQYLKTAADQLHKTRTTQTSGVLAVSMTYCSSKTVRLIRHTDKLWTY